MHNQVIAKIRKLRKEKGFDYDTMAEKLNISKTAYVRLESGKTQTWSKYLEEILTTLEISVDDFFKDIGTNINIINKKGSFGGNIHVENLFAENKDKTLKIEQLYEERLKDLANLNNELKKVNDQLKEIIELKDKIIASIENKKRS